MPTSPHFAALDIVHRIAKQEARCLCRRLRLPSHEHEDIQQELLIDFLRRLPAFDPTRGEIAGFARVCFQHRIARLAAAARRDRANRHPVSLDDILPGTEDVTVGDTLAEADGYSAWCGQPVDAVADLERRLDFERAFVAVDPTDHPLCTALSIHTPHEVGEQRILPRMRIYRRIREMRLRLLAAGICSAA